MHHVYRPTGVCAQAIEFDLEEGKVHNVRFYGGCPGNLTAIPKLIEGESAEKVISTLKGNPCGRRPTSCTDQLAIALEQALAQA